MTAAERPIAHVIASLYGREQIVAHIVRAPVRKVRCARPGPCTHCPTGKGVTR